MAARASFKLHDGSVCTIIRARAKAVEPKDFLDDLRSKFPKLAIQIIADDAVYDQEHLEWVARQGWLAKERGVMLAKKVELDILMRVACASQISEALRVAGARTKTFIVLAIGNEGELEKLGVSVRGLCELIEFSEGNKRVLQRFGITSEHVKAAGKDKIAMMLAEKGLLAVVEKL